MSSVLDAKSEILRIMNETLAHPRVGQKENSPVIGELLYTVTKHVLVYMHLH